MVDQVTTAQELGATLRARRQRLRLTQAQLAQRAQVSRQWLVRLERGHRSAELGLVLDVARALGVAIEFGSVAKQVAGEIDLDHLGYDTAGPRCSGSGPSSSASHPESRSH